MRIGIPAYHSQVSGFVLSIIIAALVYSCTRDSGEVIIVPPPTFPLTRSFIGYGVVNVSYTLVSNDPEQSGVSLGFLRKGSIVRILERRSINIHGSNESWVLVEGSYRGWLREGVLDIYDLEAQAGTAAEGMSQ